MRYKIVALALVCSLVFLAACNTSAPREPVPPTSPAAQPATAPSGNKTPTSTPSDKATPAPLSPARNLVGTWVTPFPVKFYIQTDFQNLQGTLEDAASLDRLMTWAITATGNENEVNIECSATDSNIQQAEPPIAYTPAIFPIDFRGTVSGSRLITPFGEFNFTTDIITGTWDYTDDMLYKQREYTKTNALTLTRRSGAALDIPQGTQTPALTVRASLLAGDTEYNRLRDVFQSWGFDFDALYEKYSRMAVTENWTVFWIGSESDEAKRVTFDRVGDQWKPRAIP